MTVSGTSSGQPLPDGWRWVKLKETGNFEAGGTPAKERIDYWNGKIPFVTGADITELCISKANARAFLTKDGLFSGKTVICEAGTVIIVTRTRVGRSGIAQETMGASQDITAFKCGPEIHQEFLCRYLHNISEHLIENCRGATIQGLTREFIDNLEIPLPPIEEQRRIAGLLREQMTAVEKARAAVQVRLEAVKALPAAFLRQVFPQPGQPLPDGWRWVKLGEVCKVQGGYAFNSEHYVQQGIPIIRISNLIEGIVTLTADTVYVSKEMHVGLEQFMLREGDLLIAMSGATTGKLGKINSSVLPAYLNQRVGRFIPIGDSLDTSFLGYLLSQPGYLIGIFENAFGCAIPNVSPGFIESVDIPLAPLDEQWRIAAELREQMAAVEKTRAAVEAELNTINALPATLLRRAFNGEF